MIVDDRSPQQKLTHHVIWLATDRFLSHWNCNYGTPKWNSYAGWACKPQDSPKVEAWVRNRGDMIRVREVTNSYKTRSDAHAHIYLVDDQHPALS